MAQATPVYVKCKGVPKGRCAKVSECQISRNFHAGSINVAPSNFKKSAGAAPI